MFRLLLFILIFIFSFNVSAIVTITNKIGLASAFTFDYCSGDDAQSANCAQIAPSEIAYGDGNTYYKCPLIYSSSTRIKYRLGSQCNDSGNITATLYLSYSVGCQSPIECHELANLDCSSTSRVVTGFVYTSPNVYSYSCEDFKSESDKCNDVVKNQCANNWGVKSSNYTDDGQGTTSCTGVCNDGSIPKEEDCSVYPFCDVPEPPSDLDFGSGGTGSSVDPSTTTTEDVEHDIDYEADGTTSDTSSNISSLQGDKLINEVVATRNANTKNLASTTETTNQTIVEKSDDISTTVSNSANGIIDAVNRIEKAVFDDKGIIGAVNSLGSGIDGLGDKIDGLGDELGGSYQSDFGVASFSAYDTLFINESDLTGLTDGFKASIGVENRLFINEVREKFNFTAGNSGGYQANNLDLGKWGSHDISLARFSEYFGGVGNVVYFLAALSALTIVLGGIKS
ncbi:hypothetical protein [Colwellia psychrerythraea]|uniref:Uncharacterized protein n=1 Tax=Colwellia psychrerythraea (strain 34H / ATCC BAA-681) TaxID=167879 RepID=Q489Z3_COLP3|nr:hypothetical protein [Colwellia psychrerythraea]AAZ27213.1 hypothetical protein CPS_0363 [Colwellia psychrerythraea 34H]